MQCTGELTAAYKTITPIKMGTLPLVLALTNVGTPRMTCLNHAIGVITRTRHMHKSSFLHQMTLPVDASFFIPKSLTHLFPLLIFTMSYNMGPLLLNQECSTINPAKLEVEAD